MNLVESLISFQSVSSDIMQNVVWTGKTFIDIYLSWNIIPSLFKKWYEGESFLFCSLFNCIVWVNVTSIRSSKEERSSAVCFTLIRSRRGLALIY